jgi:hypothetical protein
MTIALTIQHMLLPSFCDTMTSSFFTVVAKLVPNSLKELDYVGLK